VVCDMEACLIRVCKASYACEELNKLCMLRAALVCVCACVRVCVYDVECGVWTQRCACESLHFGVEMGAAN